MERAEGGEDHDPFAVEVFDGFLGRGCHDGRLDLCWIFKFLGLLICL